MTHVPVNRPANDATIIAGRIWLKSVYREGVNCPCCGQRVQLYKRVLNRSMVRGLAEIYVVGGTDWVHLPTAIPQRSREEAKLAHWGLLEESVDKREDGGAAGWWRVTLRGEDFLNGNCRVPKYVLLYDGKHRGHEGDLICVSEVIEGFDLQKLLDGTS